MELGFEYKGSPELGINMCFVERKYDRGWTMLQIRVKTKSEAKLTWGSTPPGYL